MHINEITFQTHDTKMPTFYGLLNHTDNKPHVINTTTIINMKSNLTHLHSINGYQTVQTSYFSSYTHQPTQYPADGI